VNLLNGNVNAIRGNTDSMVDASKGVDLDVNQGPFKGMIIFRHQNVKQNRNMKTSNISTYFL
jgi:hypothetical protein